MNKIFVFLLILFFTNCSLNENSKLWKKEDKEIDKIKGQKKVFVEEKKKFEELNPLLKLDLLAKRKSSKRPGVFGPNPGNKNVKNSLKKSKKVQSKSMLKSFTSLFNF